MKTPQFVKAFKKALIQLLEDKVENKVEKELELNKTIEQNQDKEKLLSIVSNVLTLPNVRIEYIDIVTIPIGENIEEILKFEENNILYNIFVEYIIKTLGEENIEIFNIYNNILVTEKGYLIIGNKDLSDKVELKFYGKITESE